MLGQGPGGVDLDAMIVSLGERGWLELYFEEASQRHAIYLFDRTLDWH